MSELMKFCEKGDFLIKNGKNDKKKKNLHVGC